MVFGGHGLARGAPFDNLLAFILKRIKIQIGNGNY